MKYQIHPQAEIGHIHLIVTKLDRSLRFYTEVIGFQVLEQEEKRAVLTTDGTTPLVVLEEKEEAVRKPPRTTGLYHFAILVPDRASLARALLHLLQTRYPLHGASDHQFSEAVYLADPDGNGIEIYADRPRDEWEKTERGEYKGTTVPLDVEGLLAEAGGVPWMGLPAETKIGHVHLHVADLQEAEKFYHQGLGFEIAIRMGNHALFVGAGGYHHHIGLNTWAGVGAPQPPDNAVGLHMFSINLPNEEELAKIIERLEGIGVSVKCQEKAVVAVDQSGHRIQLKVKE
ncbi:VOC family protein [Anoxybacteroides tepidamans]|uniref:VOC family protein n=1 Tax=Anoxybacteroides tepidamans TaxID=265948 RepID=UPI000481B361|nr:VOC family protein [Anoxybacillus tepidamans]